MWLRRWRGDVVVGVVEMWFVEMRLWWLLQNNDSKIIILPQRSQPGYTNNSLSTSVGKSDLNTHLSI